MNYCLEKSNESDVRFDRTLNTFFKVSKVTFALKMMIS